MRRGPHPNKCGRLRTLPAGPRLGRLTPVAVHDTGPGPRFALCALDFHRDRAMTAIIERPQPGASSPAMNNTGLVVAVSLGPNWLAGRLIARGHGVRYASTIESALHFLDEDDPDLVLIDDALPDE